MPSLQAIPRGIQREEPWANGAGVTRVVLREPDSADWRVRVSVARVEHEGPFSELPGTRRTLVPLDAPMALQFPDDHTLHAARFGNLRFAGVPAPTGRLPEGPTRDFNLMLRGDARGEAFARTLVGSMLLPRQPGERWLVYLDSGHASVRADGGEALALNPGDAALVIANDAPARAIIEGAGEVVLVKLYG